MIKHLAITKELLITYFTSDNVLFAKHHSIGNLAKFFNQLRAEASGAYKKSRFPNHYDSNLVKKQTPIEYQEYCKHLVSLGFTPVKHLGTIIDWKDGPQSNTTLTSQPGTA